MSCDPVWCSEFSMEVNPYGKRVFTVSGPTTFFEEIYAYAPCFPAVLGWWHTTSFIRSSSWRETPGLPGTSTTGEVFSLISWMDVASNRYAVNTVVGIEMYDPEREMSPSLATVIQLIGSASSGG